MINPVAISIGSLEIRWYGIIYALFFFIGILIACRLGKKRNLTKDDIYDFALYLIPLSVIGARLFHVFFYNFSYYMQNPSQIIAIWNGGVSLYGGIFGAGVAAFIFCRKKKILFYDLADVFVIPLAFGTIFGRIGNFINGELYGKVTNLPWGVYFEGVSGKRHPTQIYEAIGNLIVFLVLIFIWRKNPKKGVMFWTYMGLYSAIRFLAEFVRDDKAVFLGMTPTQLVIIPIFAYSVYYLVKANKTTV